MGRLQRAYWIGGGNGPGREIFMEITKIYRMWQTGSEKDDKKGNINNNH